MRHCSVCSITLAVSLAASVAAVAGVASGTHGAPATGHAARPGESAPAQNAERRKGDPYYLPESPFGQRLGEEPVVRVYEGGREVRFASEREAERFEGDLEKNLTALDEKMAKDQAPYYPMTVCLVAEHPPKEGEEWVQMVHNNRLVRFCCEGCIWKFEQNPEEYLAKLDEAVKEQQGEAYPLEECIVAGEELGGMGEPTTMVLANRLVKFCCAGCESDVKEQPAEYITRLDKAWHEEHPEKFADAE